MEIREEVAFGNCEGAALDVEDVGFLARDVWRAKSARAEVARAEKGLSRFTDDLAFTRCCWAL